MILNIKDQETILRFLHDIYADMYNVIEYFVPTEDKELAKLKISNIIQEHALSHLKINLEFKKGLFRNVGNNQT